MSALRQEFEREGWAVAPGLFDSSEVEAWLAHVMEIRRQPRQGDDGVFDPESAEPLLRYPRIVQPHRWDTVSLDFMLHPKLGAALGEMLGEPPLAVQTMIYFKPPGARGQALHQDQFYLNVRPDTCVAAWLALDDCDEENGCMSVVPGSQHLPVLCTVPADTSVSFTDVTVPLPAGVQPIPVVMKAGDVLFFNGSLIHGSGPNRSESRFRRSYIGHYAPARSTAISRFYHEAWTFDRQRIDLELSEGGGQCGEYVDGSLVMRAAASASAPH